MYLETTYYLEANMNALLLQQTEQLVESLQNENIMGNLLKLSIEKDKIEQLQAKIGELEDRLLQQERYTSPLFDI